MDWLNQLRKYSTKIVFSYDVAAFVLSWWLSYVISYNFSSTSLLAIIHNFKLQCMTLSVQIFFYWIFKTYKSLWRFFSFPGLLSLLKATLCAWVVNFTLVIMIDHYISIPKNILFIYPAWLILMLGLGRLLIRLSSDINAENDIAKRVLIIGAGKGAELFLRDVKRWPEQQYNPIACLDDDPSLKDKEIRGIPIVGKIEKLLSVVCEKNIDLIVIAIPSIKAAFLRDIVQNCEEAKVAVRILPSLTEIMNNTAQDLKPREISLEDLLGRDPVTLDREGICSYIAGEVVLVSGGGGSIGFELCHQIAKFHPRKLIILDHSEFNLYQAEMALKNIDTDDIFIELVSINDSIAIREVIKKHKPAVIFHAAAYKHVPILENQIFQAVKNNILGTTVLAEAAIAGDVRKFVMVSTDKAVNPTNIMGMTKRIAEIFCRTYNKNSKTAFITVRFGNVIGSSGSVIPLFKKQVENGGPITVTDPGITRYFMTLQEASQLILQAGYQGNGGEIFVLDMGQPVKILDIAKQLIKLYGKNEDEIGIKYTGLRPGEKMYEELFYATEPLSDTVQEKIFKANTTVTLSLEKMQEAKAKLKMCCESYDAEMLMQILNDIQGFKDDLSKQNNIIAESTVS